MDKNVTNQAFVKAATGKMMGTSFRQLMSFEAGQDILTRLMAFKLSERKDDPERRVGLHGPYEQMILVREGRLPADYYDGADNTPWGLRVEESRSNILWQVLSGLMDHRPEFAAAYMGLSLDQTLSHDEYARELEKLHTTWTAYLQSSSVFNNHHHSVMRTRYHSVSCPACSLLTAMVSQDEGMNKLFRELVPLTLEERKHFMEIRGFTALLNIMIPSSPIIGAAGYDKN